MSLINQIFPALLTLITVYAILRLKIQGKQEKLVERQIESCLWILGSAVVSVGLSMQFGTLVVFLEPNMRDYVEVYFPEAFLWLIPGVCFVNAALAQHGEKLRQFGTSDQAIVNDALGQVVPVVCKAICIYLTATRAPEIFPLHALVIALFVWTTWSMTKPYLAGLATAREEGHEAKILLAQGTRRDRPRMRG